MDQNIATNPKASFDDCYTSYSPSLYASVLLQGLNYCMPFAAMQLLKQYLDNADMGSACLETVLLGSGHGLEATALKYGHSCDDIIHLWANNPPEKHIFSGGDPRFEFTMMDINEPPLRFAQDVGLCKQYYACDISQELPNEIKTLLLERTDMLGAIGLASYIGFDGFKAVVDIVGAGNIKYFFFSLPSFRHNLYLEAFNGSNLQVEQLGSIKQRDYKDDEEKARILDNINKQGGQCTDDDKAGYMTSIYIARKP